MLCSPAIVYLIFSCLQIAILVQSGQRNAILMRIIVIAIITGLLQLLCSRGQNTIAWLIVFIPFIFMTFIMAAVAYVFGNEQTHSTNQFLPPNVTTDPSNNIIIYDPYYDPRVNPVYYKSPNVIVPSPPAAPYVPTNTTTSTPSSDITTTTIPL